MLKKFFIMCTLLIFVLVGCTKNQPQEAIKIGAILPMTGFVSIYGQTEKEAIDYAVREINQTGALRVKN